MTDPMDEIEFNKTNYDFGVMAAEVLKGVLSNSDTRMDAWFATSAFFYGMFKANGPDKDDDS